MFKKLNELIDQTLDDLASALATKICFFIFCIIAIVPLFKAFPQDILAWQSWLSQTCIQLIALSILAVASAKVERLVKQLLELIIKKEDEIKQLEEKIISIEEKMDRLLEIILSKEEEIAEELNKNG